MEECEQKRPESISISLILATLRSPSSSTALALLRLSRRTRTTFNPMLTLIKIRNIFLNKLIKWFPWRSKSTQSEIHYQTVENDHITSATVFHSFLSSMPIPRKERIILSILFWHRTRSQLYARQGYSVSWPTRYQMFYRRGLYCLWWRNMYAFRGTWWK